MISEPRRQNAYAYVISTKQSSALIPLQLTRGFCPPNPFVCPLSVDRHDVTIMSLR